jgi:glycerol-3-phosphate dehydrogenase
VIDRLGHADEVTYLLATVAQALPDRRMTFDNVAYTYAGVRPLSFDGDASASKVSRQHRVISEGSDGRFFSVTGTKLTCFRSLAEDVGDRVMRALGRRAPSRTARLALDGTDEEAGTVEARVWMDVSAEMAATGLGRETLETVIETYGRGHARILDLAKKLPDGTERLCPGGEIVAQLHHAVSDSWRCRSACSSGAGISQSRCQGLDCAAPIRPWPSCRLVDAGDAELDAYHPASRSVRFRS